MCISRTPSSTTQSLTTFGRSKPDVMVSSKQSNSVFPSARLSAHPLGLKPDVLKSTSLSGSSKTCVQHNYHDHSREEVDEVTLSREILKAKGGVSTPFPIKLHQMLKCVESDGHGHIVNWAPHGRAFVVHKPKEFVDVVLRKYFNQTKIASFQRQLNLYGFNRLTQGPDKNGYYHELFIRSKPLLAHKIHRIRIKGTMVRQRTNPDQEPNFYKMPSCDQDPIRTQKKLVTPPSPKSAVLAATIFPEDVVSASLSIVLDPLFCFAESIHDAEDDDVASVFGKVFHKLDAEHQSNDSRYYEPDDLDFTRSFGTAEADEMMRILEKSDFEEPTASNGFDETPNDRDEDIAHLLASMVSA